MITANRHFGFTLIEIMIVVAIVAILASVAYPSYVEQVRKSRRADCAAELMLLANQIEQFYTLRNTYVGIAAAIPGPPTAAGLSTYCPRDSTAAQAFYTFDVTAATATDYTLQANRNGPQNGDRCGDFTLNRNGDQGIANHLAGLTRDDCW